MSTEERIDVLDENGNSLGYSEPRSVVHSKGLWHRVVHVWIVDSDGKLLIQRRSNNKESFPGYWDNSSAGHIEAGQTSKDAAIRELNEELGILHSVNDLELLFTYNKQYVLRSGKYLDNEIADVYLITYTFPFDLSKLTLQVEEVSDVKLIPHHELLQMVVDLSPTFVPLFDSSKSSFEKSVYYQLFEILEKRYPTKQ
ncbi:hypothetical protein DLAC_09344 [Tieghemostelium lacteum]|uniref:Nudix hydrolase domain-containing protein n=1 Tax=Tieghemostelium lacteum TaxID=361077 RepID=A0A151Z9T4_TIELA|nr:hypothetical protein DLAC_09344 [Tieghemostelium lacteum]|eukprot:KYQ90709.1 hypothetical protein DLAC_09344 [Tieghemostelium lacteum]